MSGPIRCAALARTTESCDGAAYHMRLEEFDFDLPSDLIAQHPTADRDGSRLLVLNRARATHRHFSFRDLPRFLRAGDALVVNETKVFPARLRGRKRDTGGCAEFLLVRKEAGGEVWLALARPARSLKPGSVVEIGDGSAAVEVLESAGPGRVRVRIERTGAPGEGDTEIGVARLLEQFGEVPLPPYIQRRAASEDRLRYQTVFAREQGAIAAPTAGLHFTVDLLSQIADAGVAVTKVLLHVGPGTFEPVRTPDPRDHKLEAEYYELSDAATAELNERRRSGGRVVAVGTTVVRALETAADDGGHLRPGKGWTDRFIYPPYQFKAVDALVTNFHLPRSSLLMLVAAFAGQALMRRSYESAIELGYRFYSYGDAMLIE